MTEQRTKDMLREVLDFIRVESSKHPEWKDSDWKDYDDYLFSNLSITKSEIMEIYSEKDFIYIGSCVDE